MKPDTEKLLDKAQRSIQSALRLLESNDVEFAVSRIYYAMFYTAEALLNEKELKFRKHSGVHAAFGANIVKAGLMDSKYHRWLLDAFDKRILSDYGLDVAYTKEVMDPLLRQANDFLAAAKQLIR